ncbi:MAG: MFS transporter [Candidatus Saccharimonas sp.]
MIQRIISQLFRRRHYWRLISFDEIAELYVSRLLTVFAINIVNLFAAVYLYKLGYSVQFIIMFYGLLYLGKIPFSYLAARYAAHFGPKHGIFMANVLRIPSLISFALLPVFGLPAVIAFGILQQMAATMYDLCYLINFSKVRSSTHTGKEIGTMQIMEKIARLLSPIIGGVIATLYTPEATIIVAAVLFIVSTIPLFRTVEPTRTRTKIVFSGFPWRLARRSLVSETVVGFDFVASGVTWTLFVALFIFGDLGENVYAALGGLASLGVVVSMVTSWIFGQIVDRKKGHILLIAGTFANTIIHLFRPFMSTPAGVMGVNIANETATSAYGMPFLRVMFDVADRSGHRIAYMMFIEMALNFGTSMACVVLSLSIHFMGVKGGMTVFFFIAAFYELLLLLSRRAAR